MSDAINPVDWFEIPVNDIARATAFYQRALGVTLKPMEQGPMKMAWFTGQPGGSGANGMLVQGPGRTPSKTGTLVYFTVPEIDACAKATAGTIRMSARAAINLPSPRIDCLLR